MLLEKLWDDVVAGPPPAHGITKLRQLQTQTNSNNKEGEKYQTMSMPSPGSTSASPLTPTTPRTPNSAKKENVWRSVFHPGSNLNTRNIGAHIFDKPSQSTTVYDWLYSEDSRSSYR